ncbi:MAG TPA: hypothetical protein VNA68_03340 [Candidatus Dormibacteraeota bacterium]|nr:hypothetical protein [Candidatus Dormibacteraeota bacterium]
MTKQLLELLIKKQKTLIAISIGSILIYTLYQISLITTIGPDQAYLEKQKENIKTTQLKVDQKTIEAIRNLVPARESDLSPTGGKSDPFSF